MKMNFRTLLIFAGALLLFRAVNPGLHAQSPTPRRVSADQPPSEAGISRLQPSPDLRPVGPKKEGTVRVGVVTPVAHMGPNLPGSGIVEPLRTLFMQHLAGPTLEAIAIDAVQPVQVDAEGKSKDCDYILYSNLSQRKSGGGGLSMLRNAAPLINMIPMVGMAAGVGGAIASQVASAAAAGGMSAAGAVKAKSEVTLGYKLVRPGLDSPVLESSLKAKAATDGEDVITPLLSQVVASALSEIQKKK
jgi:hypothetical protein